MRYRGHTAALVLVTGLAASCSGNVGNEPANESPRAEGSPDGTSGTNREDGTAIDPSQFPAFAPAPAQMRRLTLEEYGNSLRDLLGTPLTVPGGVEPDVVLFGFTTVGAAASDISLRGIESYETAAHEVAREVMASPSRRRALIGCDPTTPADPCVRRFIESFGRRAWRRPLTPAEADDFAALISGVAMAPGNMALAFEYTLAAFLQAPSFLYRSELGYLDPKHPELRRYSGWDMAARLSFFLWSTTPDDELLEAAAMGDLDQPSGVASQAARLLEHPKARQGVLRFFAELLELAKLDALKKDPMHFPSAPTLGPLMRTEAERMIESLVLTRSEDVRNLLDTRQTFLNGALAQHYGLPAPTGDEFVPVTLPAENARAGLLGLGGFLSLLADGVSTSPTLRGKFVREILLCQDIPAPPEGVVTEIEPERFEQPTTLRQRLDVHRKEPACAGCHALMDPIGFAMENFDALGTYRQRDNGLPIDASGDLDGVRFDGLKELADAVKAQPAFEDCIARHAYRFAAAHEVGEGEEVVLANLVAGFRKNGRRFTDLLAQIARSDGFRFARDPR